MARYKVNSEWSVDNDVFAPFIIECADIVDTRSGATFVEGAFRVVVDGKPAVRGKGGTVPFYGEVAWSDAQRLAWDLQSAERFVRTS